MPKQLDGEEVGAEEEKQNGEHGKAAVPAAAVPGAAGQGGEVPVPLGARPRDIDFAPGREEGGGDPPGSTQKRSHGTETYAPSEPSARNDVLIGWQQGGAVKKSDTGRAPEKEKPVTVPGPQTYPASEPQGISTSLSSPCARDSNGIAAPTELTSTAPPARTKPGAVQVEGPGPEIIDNGLYEPTLHVEGPGPGIIDDGLYEPTMHVECPGPEIIDDIHEPTLPFSRCAAQIATPDVEEGGGTIVTTRSGHQRPDDEIIQSEHRLQMQGVHPAEAAPAPDRSARAPEAPYSAVLVPDRTRTDAAARIEEEVRRRVLDGAPLVEDACVIPIQDSPPKTNGSNLAGTTNGRMRRIVIFVAAALTVVSAVAVTLGVSLRRRQPPPPVCCAFHNQSTILNGTKKCPNGMPPITSTSERYANMKRKLQIVSGRDVLEDACSPQHRALVWIADQDERDVSWNDTEEVVPRFALSTLFFATGGEDSWIDGSNFLSRNHVCDWNEDVEEYGYDTPFKGVFCFKNTTTVRAVWIPLNNMTGSLPREIGQLSGLEILTLFDNNLASSIPSEIGLTSLTDVFISGNYLKSTIPSEIGVLSTLQNVNIESNELTGSIPSEIGQLTNLHMLFLSNNLIGGAIPTEVGNLQQLKMLLAGQNILTSTLPQSLSTLSNMTDLYLYDNLLTGRISPLTAHDAHDVSLFTGHDETMIIIRRLALPKIKTLMLEDNQFSGEIPSSINDLRQLENLWLGNNDLVGTLPFTDNSFPNLLTLSMPGNSLSGEIPESISTYNSLIKIYLQENHLSGVIPQELGNLAHLQILFLGWNELVGTIPPSFADLGELSFLSLSNNHLSGAIPLELGHLHKLRQFHLSENRIISTIPSTIGDMSSLVDLGLNENNLSGPVPRELSRLLRLSVLALNRNDLTGDASFLCQQGKRFDLFVADCYGTNPEVLCPCCTACCSDDEVGDFYECFLNT